MSGQSSPTLSANSTPKPSLPLNSSPKAAAPTKMPSMDTSIEAWIYNIRTVLHFPGTILTIAGLLLAGGFAETAPRKSLEILDSAVGHALFFIIPLFFALMLDWATGLLAASICLIIFARLKKSVPDSDLAEGFSNSYSGSDSVQNTKIVSSTQRWFVEKVLGERPIAISSDRIITKRYEDNDSRTSSSSSMSSNHSSDGTK
jgi:hypothetical protein